MIVRRKGFTLIELLVVISIIALLMSVMMPALGKARRMGKRLVCKSRIRQVLIAESLYEKDNDSWITPAVDYTSKNGFMTRLQKYGIEDESFMCPEQKMRDVNGWGDLLCHFGINVDIAGVINDVAGKPVRATGNLAGAKMLLVKRPSELILFADVDPDRVSGYLHWGFQYGGGTAFERRYSERHDKGSNYGFADCHVDFSKDWQKFNKEKYINVVDGRWH